MIGAMCPGKIAGSGSTAANHENAVGGERQSFVIAAGVRAAARTAIAKARDGHARRQAKANVLSRIPGIYRRWKGPIKKAGPNVTLKSCSFMTTLPNTLTSTINHERSPVPLARKRASSPPASPARPRRRLGRSRPPIRSACTSYNRGSTRRS